MPALFRGVRTGNVDDKGRLKLPAFVKRLVKEHYNHTETFVTSIDGERALVYPIIEWERVEADLAAKSTGADSAKDGAIKKKILFQANHFGSEETIDGQGRLLVPAPLRESADMRGAVRIQWQSNHILVMTEARYNAEASSSQLTSEDLDYAANLGM